MLLVDVPERVDGHPLFVDDLRRSDRGQRHAVRSSDDEERAVRREHADLHAVLPLHAGNVDVPVARTRVRCLCLRSPRALDIGSGHVVDAKDEAALCEGLLAEHVGQLAVSTSGASSQYE